MLYYFPPVTGTAAKRNFRIAKAISQKAESVLVYTASQVQEGHVSTSDVTVQRIKAFDYRALLRRRTKDGALPEESKSNVFAQSLIRLINTVPFNIIAGEGGLFYFFKLMSRANKVIRQKGITHLYSSYRPFADHYAAYWLKKKNPELIWIADFRDLVIDPHYRHILFPEAHHRFFKKLFAKADVLTTVSDGLAAHLRAYHPKVITLRNGIDAIAPTVPIATAHFTIAYTGSMFLDKRNAEPLFLALQQLFQDALLEAGDIRIVYAGKDSRYWKNMARKYRFESILEDRGMVSGEEATRIQKEACINLLLTISSEALRGVLTGKMIEYFESGSPVLGIIVGDNDPELIEILAHLEAGATFSDQPHDLDAIKDFLNKEYLLWKQSGHNRKPLNTQYLKHHYAQEAVMEPLYSILELEQSDNSIEIGTPI